ncbi:MAG TPA: 50S ribosomal protein L25 [Candidatus Eisenbacteria bacterium]|nr:50S ribosomal protein L25 [Candidatus Eisenbacteria bacterium]
MAVIPLKGNRRENLGKGGARKARAAGDIPAVLYGHGEQPVAVSIQARELDLALRAHKGGNPIVNLAVSGGEFTALIRDVQYDPLTHDILHLDFQHISLTETIEVKVAVHLTGLPLGVKDGGGILETILRELEVRCLPTAIPASIQIDVSHLNIGDSVHVREVSVPDVTILNDGGETIATVVPPTVMEEKAAEEVAVGDAAATAEPEVITKGKKDEDEAAAGEGKDKKEKKEEKGKK